MRTSMPSHAEIRWPLLALLKTNVEMTAGDMCSRLARLWDLTKSVLDEVNEDACSKWENRVRWERQNLVNDGLVESVDGRWRLTKLGLKIAEAIPGFKPVPGVPRRHRRA